MRIDRKEIERIVTQALKEDIGSGDITTKSIVPKDKNIRAYFYAKDNGVIAGLKIAKSVFRKLDDRIIWKNMVEDGDKVTYGTKIAMVEGSCRALLSGERTALNILQRVSGIATLTSEFVDKIKGTNVKILDTRKTVPGLRLLDKYGVKIGGGTNHRTGLYDMVLIKDNHIKIAGSIKLAVKQVRKNLKKNIIIEVEASTLNDVRQHEHREYERICRYD
jgi:nicotinate-nucleotide pyrophosphorylase (carboxylating)